MVAAKADEQENEVKVLREMVADLQLKEKWRQLDERLANKDAAY